MLYWPPNSSMSEWISKNIYFFYYPLNIGQCSHFCTAIVKSTILCCATFLLLYLPPKYIDIFQSVRCLLIVNITLQKVQQLFWLLCDYNWYVYRKPIKKQGNLIWCHLVIQSLFSNSFYSLSSYFIKENP